MNVELKGRRLKALWRRDTGQIVYAWRTDPFGEVADPAELAEAVVVE